MQKSLDGVRVSVDLAEEFAKTPSAFQREWVLTEALKEFTEDLQHLDKVARTFVPGIASPLPTPAFEAASAGYGESDLVIQGMQVMQAWEQPLMKAMADAITTTAGDILEVGFGMGISATLLQEHQPRSHTIIECNAEVITRFEHWKAARPSRDIRLLPGRWQDVAGSLGQYDGILFDTYPITEEEASKAFNGSGAYAFSGEFFPIAAKHLKPGGLFTYYTSEIDTLSRAHQRLLLSHFDSINVSVVRGLSPPVGCQYWWTDSMVLVTAVKR